MELRDTFSLGDYRMRPLIEEDLKIIFDWRNSARIHEMMLTNHIISWTEHIAWFERVKAQRPCRNFIFIYQDTPIGYIGYSAFDIEKKSCSPGAYLGDVMKADVASGLFLMFMMVEYAFSILKMEILETSVFRKNKHALGIDHFVGFMEVRGKEKECKKAGVVEKILLLRLDRQYWLQQKKKLLNMMGQKG